ncbi:MAG: hypothetical protein J6Q48_01235 [Bacteroidaceae bacterium]|nr:hypothetical protein [Bacteroidaceae bacterium]
MKAQTVKEFLKGTRNNYFIEISAGTNENIVFAGTYADLKKNGKEFLAEIVTSWDVVEMDDNTLEIGIMI